MQGFMSRLDEIKALAAGRHSGGAKGEGANRVKRGGLVGVLFAICTAGCAELNPNRGNVSLPTSVISVVADSPRVRLTLAEAAASDQHDRRKLISFIDQQPSVEVTGAQYFRILQKSGARCLIGAYTNEYIGSG